jgi:hypothetical protein
MTWEFCTHPLVLGPVLLLVRGERERWEGGRDWSRALLSIFDELWKVCDWSARSFTAFIQVRGSVIIHIILAPKDILFPVNIPKIFIGLISALQRKSTGWLQKTGLLRQLHVYISKKQSCERSYYGEERPVSYGSVLFPYQYPAREGLTSSQHKRMAADWSNFWLHLPLIIRI